MEFSGTFHLVKFFLSCGYVIVRVSFNISGYDLLPGIFRTIADMLSSDPASQAE